MQEPYPARAVAVGLQLSLIFTVLSVGIACIFRLLARMERSQPQPVMVSDFVEMFFNS
jgi:ascorbate-specific PTS system EIIC-type component UlaA